MEVFCCFTVAIGLPGDASDHNEDKKVGSCSAHAKQGGCRVRQQWELGVRFWRFGPYWSSCQKIKMMQYVFYCDLWKQKISACCFPSANTGLAPHLTELSKVFEAGCFDFAQVKASVELCINRFSDDAAKSELKTDCEKFDSELGELGTLDGLADSCVSSGMAFGKGAERLSNWSFPYNKWRQEWTDQLPRHLFAKPPRKSACQDGLILSAIFVAAVALQNKFPLQQIFEKSWEHANDLRRFLSTSGKYMAGFFVKSFGGVVGVRRWWVPLAGRQSLYSCSEDCVRIGVSGELNHDRSALVSDSDNDVCCSLSLYRGSPHYGPRAKSDLRSHFIAPQKHILLIMKK